jgi:basic membrane lipoprotein Med (substrate-binding protein (PBP1-ABC) superfamily)
MIHTLYTTEFCSIVFAPVRASIWGVREGMLTANETLHPLGRLPLAIAAEMNLDYIGNPDPDIRSGPSWMITSVVARSNIALYNAVNATLWDRFAGGELENFNLANSGVNITDFQFSNTIVASTYIDSAWDYTRAIINGTITVNDS